MSKSKSGYEIRKLIEEFKDEYHNSEYLMYMAHHCEEEETEEYEYDLDRSEDMLSQIAHKISNLNPSKYMMEKYPELDDILSNYLW